MAKSYEELMAEHNKIAREYNAVHKEDPAKGEELKMKYQKLWKQIQDLKASNKGMGGDE